MKERPIIFNDEMVRAILDGRKTQTRRVIKKELLEDPSSALPFLVTGKSPSGAGVMGRSLTTKDCPHGSPGDRLWVREVWGRSRTGALIFRADTDGVLSPSKWNFWQSPIHLKRIHSRITLEIKSVRVERVQEITEEDAKAEGLKTFTKDGALLKYSHDANDLNWADMSRSPIGAFTALWDSINEKKGFGWDENPWVWVIEFKRLTTQEEEE